MRNSFRLFRNVSRNTILSQAIFSKGIKTNSNQTDNQSYKYSHAILFKEDCIRKPELMNRLNIDFKVGDVYPFQTLPEEHVLLCKYDQGHPSLTPIFLVLSGKEVQALYEGYVMRKARNLTWYSVHQGRSFAL